MISWNRYKIEGIGADQESYGRRWLPSQKQFIKQLLCVNCKWEIQSLQCLQQSTQQETNQRRRHSSTNRRTRNLNFTVEETPSGIRSQGSTNSKWETCSWKMNCINTQNIRSIATRPFWIHLKSHILQTNIIKENICCGYALEIAQEERSIFISFWSMFFQIFLFTLPLDAYSIVSNQRIVIKRRWSLLFHHLPCPIS